MVVVEQTLYSLNETIISSPLSPLLLVIFVRKAMPIVGGIQIYISTFGDDPIIIQLGVRAQVVNLHPRHGKGHGDNLTFMCCKFTVGLTAGIW